MNDVDCASIMLSEDAHFSATQTFPFRAVTEFLPDRSLCVEQEGLIGRRKTKLSGEPCWPELGV